MKALLKQWVPPIIKSLRHHSFRYGWKGNYKSFEEAKMHCKGYDEHHILERISTTTSKVKNEEAAYERDGIVYDEIKVNTNVLTKLLTIAAENGSRLTVIDFGGSLGTSYYQHLPFLQHLKELNWCIVEQDHYVKRGKKEFQNEHLKFYYTIEECLVDFPNANMLLMSSSIQYVEKPYEMLCNFQALKIPYLLLDYIGFNHRKQDRITVQHVPPCFYGIETSYPCLFFNRHKLYEQLEKDYVKQDEFTYDSDIFYLGWLPFRYEGSFWKLKDA